MLCAAAMLAAGCVSEVDPTVTRSDLHGYYAELFVILPDLNGSPTTVSTPGPSMSRLLLWLYPDGTTKLSQQMVYTPRSLRNGEFRGTFEAHGDTIVMHTGTGWPMDSARWIFHDAELRSVLPPDSSTLIVLYKISD